MMAPVASKRIARGGYSSGAMTRIAALYREPESEPMVEEPPPKIDFEAELAVRVEAARREAFADGFRQGVAKGREEIAGPAEALHNLAAQIDAGLDSIWEACRRGAGELAMQIARKIISEAAKNHQALAVELARIGVAKARDQSEVVIYVNPVDVEALKAAEVEILAVGEGLRSVFFRTKNSVPPGGVVIEAESGSFDLRPEVQLEAIESALNIVAAPDVQTHANSAGSRELALAAERPEVEEEVIDIGADTPDD